ncbi:MAG TPA: hypothetical protein VJP77_08500, partial [Planctomycetota bacterium]|nr:hypothetical protein [Planctomycetota bacterium]
RSSRSHANAQYPTDAGEAMTAVALLTRVFAADALGEELALDATLERGAELLAERPPEWSADGATNDLYYWYYGTYALYQFGGERFERWERALVRALLPAQRTSPPCLVGSWDPDGPWGYSGGRVYSTALGALCLQVHHRYGRLLGRR